MADKYDAFLDAPDTPAVKTVDKYDAFLDAPVTPDAPVQRVAPTPAPVQAVASQLGVMEQLRADAKADLERRKTAPVIGPVGMIESGLNTLTGLGSTAIGGLAGIAGAVLPGPQGQGAEWLKKIQESGTYQPRTEAGKAASGAIAAPTTLIDELAQTVGEYVGGNEGRLVGAVAPSIVGSIFGIRAPLKSIATTKFEPPSLPKFAPMENVRANSARTYEPILTERATAASAADWQRAAAIDAAKVAREHGIVMNPASVSGGGHSVKMAAAGGSTHFNTAASIANKPKWNDMVRQDLGIGENVPLTAKTYDAVRKAIAKPYDDAATLGKLTPNESAINSIREIDIPEILPAGEQAAGKMKRITDMVAEQLESGMTGKDAVNTTRTLRKEAKAVFDSVRGGNQVDHVTIQTAKAKMAIAEKIDETISSNISDPKWKSSFDESRRKMAQSYAYERATNLVRQQVDPQVFAQEMQGRHYLTGNAAKMGEIAGNYPEIANVYAERGKAFGMPVRSGPAGTLGFAVGSLYGAPVATSATAAGLASIGEKLYGKRLRSEAAQQKYATPVDRRMPLPEQTPTTPTSTSIVPYVSPVEVVDNVPNFVFGKPDQPAPRVTPVGEDLSIPRIGMTRGPVGGQMGALRAEDARVRDLSMRQGLAAEQAAAAAEAASPRVPARGGMLFDLDPVTGKLRAADQGVKGATPEIWQANTGANLRSAAEKVAAGQEFKMTAAEKVAWGKTSVDIKSVAPEFSKLTDKQVMSRMQDRQWVQSTIDKANQKAEMFAQIEKQSQDRVAQSMARIQREKMLDIAEQLQDALGARPSSRGYTQGDKTRKFQRGLLTDMGEPK